MLKKLVIQNYRRFQHCTVDLKTGMNIVVGDNGAGKSSLLEAIASCMTGRVRGLSGNSFLPTHVLNQGVVEDWTREVTTEPTKRHRFPAAFIELYLEHLEETADLKGTGNSLRQDCCGLRLEIGFDETFAESVPDILLDVANGGLFPIEYYRTEWLTFGTLPLNPRRMPFEGFLIDASRMRLNSGSDYFIRKVSDDVLDESQRRALANEYRKSKSTLLNNPGIEAVNAALKVAASQITEQEFALQPSEAPGTDWSEALQPHLDSLPFGAAGMGQSSRLKILLALSRHAERGSVFLIEEPENHLSFSSLHQLIQQISELVPGKQVIIATHSSFVMNKLGLEDVVMLNGDTSLRMTDLNATTVEYFKKLSGYDTLRVLLCRGAFLVEGPSDDLIVQRFFLDRFGSLPIQRGFDVVECRGLTAARLLEISRSAGRRVAVLTDNDGDPASARTRFGDFSLVEHIEVFTGADAAITTLEPQIVAVNSLEQLNAALGRSFDTKEDVLAWMSRDANKTQAGLSIFESEQRLTPPPYIAEAMTWLASS